MTFFRFSLLNCGFSFVALCSLLLCRPAVADQVYEDYTFITLAGPAEAGPGSRDGTNRFARFNYPGGIARDHNGNIFIADIANNTIRKITPDGMVTTFAGLAGTSGTNDGAANVARFNSPNGITVDSAGIVYVADTSNHTIRKITPDGTVTTIAGSAGVSGTKNGLGAAARFNTPVGLTTDPAGNIYVADTGNNAIRQISPDGMVTTLAGSSGHSGSVDSKRSVLGLGGRFNSPFSLTLDPSGNIFVADTGNNTIRKINLAGAVTTLAGAAGNQGSADGTNRTASFSSPEGITMDSSGNLLVADAANNLIRKITPAGVVTTIAGLAGTAGSADGSNSVASFNSPGDLTLDDQGNIYVADTQNNTIRTINSDEDVSTLAGTAAASGTNDGFGNAATFASPAGIFVDTNGILYVADMSNHTIRKITPDGAVSTVAGVPGAAGFADSTNGPAKFSSPQGVAVDNLTNVYVADTSNQTIRKITPDGTVITLAGTNGVSGHDDGTNTTALFNSPHALAADDSGNVYVADTENDTIRKITADGVVTTLAGLATVSGTNNGAGTNGLFNQPFGLTLAPDGNLYVADTFNHTIRKVTLDGVVSTVAGIPGKQGSDDGTNGAATLTFPEGVWMDSSNNLFVTTFNNTIRKVTPDGTVTTLAGTNGVSGNTDGTGSDARFNQPQSVAVDAAGYVYVADTANNTIRKGWPALPDKPTVDVAIGALGEIRHFDITNRTTISWSWDFLQYPAGSSAQFSSPTAPNPTLTPDVRGTYIVRFRGWDAQGRLAIGTLTVGVDTP